MSEPSKSILKVPNESGSISKIYSMESTFFQKLQGQHRVYIVIASADKSNTD